MQRQKTIAKWLAVILLLTLAVASYVTLRAIFGGRTQDNVAGAQDNTDTDGETPPPSGGDVDGEIGEGDAPPTVEEPPHIPVYSEFPRSAVGVGEIDVINVGGESEDVLLDRITCFGKDILIFDSASKEYDVKESGLHLASISNGALEGTLFLAEDEEYLDCTLSASGLLIVTRNEMQTLLRLVSRELKVTLKNTLPRYESYRLFTSGGVLRLYVANDEAVSVYTVSKTLSASRSSRTASLDEVTIKDIVPAGTRDMLFLQNESGISVCTYCSNEGFILQSELLNCRFKQILPIVYDSKHGFALLASNDGGYCLTKLDIDGKQDVSTPIDGAKTAAIFKDGTNLMLLSDAKLYTFCSHLEQTSCMPLTLGGTLIKGRELYATASGTLYAAGENGTSLLSLDGYELSETLALPCTAPMIISGDNEISIAFDSAEELGELGFGGKDVYFATCHSFVDK